MSEKIHNPVSNIDIKISSPIKSDLKHTFEGPFPALENIFLQIQKQNDIKTQNIQSDGIDYILDQVQEYGSFEIFLEGENPKGAKFLANRLKSFDEFGEKGYQFLVEGNKIKIFDPSFKIFR